MNIIKYEHHGTVVSVRSSLKGKHREFGLCHSCVLFKPEDRENNCKKANKLYQICVEENMVTPVWECPDYDSLEYEKYDYCPKCKSYLEEVNDGGYVDWLECINCGRTYTSGW